MHDQQNPSTEPKVVSTRTMEIVVALLFLVASGIVIYDSARLGFRWQEGTGPAPGYFPFYIAVLMGAASLVNLARAIFDREGAAQAFVSKPAFLRVLAVLLPLVVYVAAIIFLGIYVASALFISGFMLFFGGYSLLKAVPVGIGISMTLFCMFELWFLVPLPQGAFEETLGPHMMCVCRSGPNAVRAVWQAIR